MRIQLQCDIFNTFETIETGCVSYFEEKTTLKLLTTFKERAVFEAAGAVEEIGSSLSTMI